MSDKSIFCMKWGTLYSVKYVNSLYAMAKRNISSVIQMIYVAYEEKGEIKQIQCFPIPEIYISDNLTERMWNKHSTFEQSFAKKLILVKRFKAFGETLSPDMTDSLVLKN